MKIKEYSLILLVSTGFAFSIIMARYFLGFISTNTYNSIRLFASSLAYLSLFAFGRKRFSLPKDKKVWFHATMVGILDTAAPMTLILLALQYMSGGVTSIFFALSPAITILLAHFFLRSERINVRKVIGIIFAITGAVILAASGESGILDIDQVEPIGYVYIGLALILGGSMTVYTRKYMEDFQPVEVGAIRTWVAFIIILGYAMLTGDLNVTNIELTQVLLIFPVALLGNFMPLLVIFYIIKTYGATTSSMGGYVTPVITIIGGVFFLHEIVSIQMIVSMAAIIFGVLLINSDKGETQKSPEYPPPHTA